MVRQILSLFCCTLIIVGLAKSGHAQKSAQSLPIVGCYSDLREISEGIIGNGVIKIAMENGKYVGTFAELQNELGLTGEPITLKNVNVNATNMTVGFEIRAGRTVLGKLTKTGIRMSWGENRSEYGSAKSFMKREKVCN